MLGSLLEVNLRTLLAAPDGSSLSSWPQTTITLQPSTSSSFLTSSSRSTFRANFRRQNSRCLLGKARLHWGHLCQKSPCTKTASLALGYTKSGLPGRLDLTSLFRSSFASMISGLVPEARLDFIERDTPSDTGLGAGPTDAVL